MLKVTAIIPAGGAGLRMGGTTKKQFITLNNKPILAHTLEKISSSDLVNDIFIVAPEEDIRYCEETIVSHYNLRKVKKVIAGGKERQDSVCNAMKHMPSDTDIVIVHDAVRPFISKELIQVSVTTADKFGSAVAAVPETDTIKEISADRIVTKTLNRKKLWRIQTPQTFKRDLLALAIKNVVKKGLKVTDEASMIEMIKKPVKVIMGSYINIKITTPEDIQLAECILKSMEIKT